jgi:putative ABC transport system permease protein
MAAALGAGLNTAVFAVAYGVLLRPLPYAQAERLALVETETHFAQVAEWKRRLPSFERVTGYGRDRFTVRGAGEPRLAGVAIVDDEFFETLGARPEAGTPFRRGAATAVAVVSYERSLRPAGR